MVRSADLFRCALSQPRQVADVARARQPAETHEGLHAERCDRAPERNPEPHPGERGRGRHAQYLERETEVGDERTDRHDDAADERPEQRIQHAPACIPHPADQPRRELRESDRQDRQQELARRHRADAVLRRCPPHAPEHQHRERHKESHELRRKTRRVPAKTGQKSPTAHTHEDPHPPWARM
ncbi:hypothetical protein ACFPRL_05105 [Pseudoclavibacter helvolus]